MTEKSIDKSNSNTAAGFPFRGQEGQLRIVFMGTPEFAVASLDALVKAGMNIVGVITAPDKAAGRGMQLQQSAVKQYAVEKGLHILQPEKLKAPEFIEELRALKANLQIVVAFRMLPEIVWNMPLMGTVNLHGSLLPQYRGAAPINWAIINGEKQTGVTTFKLQQEIDTGDILLAETIAIGEDETAGELHDKMKEIGALLLVKTVNEMAKGNIKEYPQPQFSIIKINHAHSLLQKMIKRLGSFKLKHAPKIYTETCKIDWHRSIDVVYNLIRGLSPYPTAFTELEGKKLKIFKGKKERVSKKINVGGFETDQKTFLKYAAADGYIHIIELQLEGKKKMTVEEFLRGYRFDFKTTIVN